MATSFPGSLDALTNPLSTDTLNNPSHSAQHANANDAIEALQAKVGVNGSAVATSIDYKLNNTVATLTGTQTLTNKTLTAVRETLQLDFASGGATLNVNVLDGTVVFLATNMNTTFTVNLRGNASTTLASYMQTTGALTVSLIIDADYAPGDYPTAFTIDGTSRTVRWANATAPSAGPASGKSLIITYVVLTNGAANYFRVYGSFTSFG